MFYFFFNDTATTEIYTLSLHDALPISVSSSATGPAGRGLPISSPPCRPRADRKSTRLNSSHQIISYAVFCLKKKKISEILRTQVKTRGYARTCHNDGYRLSSHGFKSRE